MQIYAVLVGEYELHNPMEFVRAWLLADMKLAGTNLLQNLL